MGVSLIINGPKFRAQKFAFIIRFSHSLLFDFYEWKTQWPFTHSFVDSRTERKNVAPVKFPPNSESEKKGWKTIIVPQHVASPHDGNTSQTGKGKERERGEKKVGETIVFVRNKPYYRSKHVWGLRWRVGRGERFLHLPQAAREQSLIHKI